MGDDPVLELLRRRLRPPIPEEVVTAARQAVDLTRAEQADRFIPIPRSPSLPAGTLVEILGLDELV